MTSKKRIARPCLFLMVLIGLQGCGGNSIDGLNADTLRESVRELSAEMSEEERKIFAQDMYAIWANRDDEAHKKWLSQNAQRRAASRLYLANYEELYTTGFGPSYTNNYSKMARELGPLVDGKSPAQIRKEAEEIRRTVFGDLQNSLVTTRQELNDNGTRIENHLKEVRIDLASRRTDLTALRETLTRSFESALSNIRNVRQENRVARAEADFSNVFDSFISRDDKRICRIFISLTPKGGKPVKFSSAFDSLPPGEKKEIQLESAGTMRYKLEELVGASSYTSALDTVSTCSNTAITNNPKTVFRRERRAISDLEKKLASCASVVKDLKQMASSLDESIEALEKLASKPDNTNLMIPSTKARYGSCLPG